MNSNPHEGTLVGIDLGGTKLLAAVVSGDGAIVRKQEIPTRPELGVDDVIRRMEELVAALVGDDAAIRGIGVATAGTLDPSGGIVRDATNLGWRDVALGPRLSRRFGCRVTIENDANAAAYGEWVAGAGKGTEHFVYVTVSTGIGAGIVSSGRLLTGTTHSASELGHMTIDWRGPQCGCGNRGCLELYASGTAIARAAADAVRRGDPAAAEIAALAEGDASRVTAKHVAVAAAQGDALALALAREAGEAMGAGLASIVHAANPQLVALGGGALGIGEPLLAPMRESFAVRCIPSMAQEVRLAFTTLGGDAGVIGAALLACAE